MVDVNQNFFKANKLYQKGRLKDAKKEFQKVLKQSPDFVDAINMYGITLAQLGELSDSAVQFNKIISKHPENLSAYENLARIYMQSQQLSRAKDIYEVAIKKCVPSYAVHFGLGGALMSLNQYPAALESFKSAYSLNNTQPLLHINMGTVSSQLGNVNAAEAAFKKAILLDSQSVHAMLRLGQLYLKHKMSVRAEEVLYKAYQIQGNNFDVHLGLADAYQANSKEALALKHYFLAEKLNPDSQNVYTKLDKLISYSGSDEKKLILLKLTEQYVYDDWQKSISDAIKLAELTEYYDKDALLALNNFFQKYSPEQLHSKDWWKQQIEQFGSTKFAHDKLLRGIHSLVFSWSIPDEKTIASIAAFIQGTRLYSYGAGSALWERLLSDHFNVEVIATDFKPRHSYLPILTKDYSTAEVFESDTIFLSWIIRGDKGIFNILNQLKPGQKLIIVGEPPDEQGVPRICATPEMFALLDKEFKLIESIPLVQFSTLNDTASLYIKN